MILARGLGSRMRAGSSGEGAAPRDAAVEAGVKGMIDVGRPFLDYAISSLADAGITKVCLVIGSEHQQIRDRYARPDVATRVRIDFAEQVRPLGTANALLAAESFANGDDVLVVNADNYYPAEALRALQKCTGAAVAVFERDALIARSNIPSERIAAFSIVGIGSDGFLERIVEKPSPAQVRAMGTPLYMGMNSWRMSPQIFEACRRVRPSVRGELELLDAVDISMRELGVRYAVLTFEAGVLDLSTRGDIASVREALRDVTPRL